MFRYFQQNASVTPEKVKNVIRTERQAQNPGSAKKSKTNPDAAIPNEAFEIFKYALTHDGQTRPSFRGNTRFGNRERKLPQRNSFGKQITYKEYDIYPWKKGKNRGPERVVIDSEGNGYYTSDHYRTFIKIE